MLTTDVKDSISEWTAWASKPDVQRFDIALLKVWIQFERFMGDSFLQYSLGEPSESGYCPELKIQFSDESQFNVFMRDGSKTYIEYMDKIAKLSKHMFVDNPFDVILNDANITPAIEQMKALRNYIAHESGEAKRKIVNTCFSGNATKFKEPNEFLLSKEKTTKNSYYTYYVTIISTVVDIVANI